MPVADGRGLFEQLVQVASGYTPDQVTEAAVNLLLNSLRQSHSRHGDAAAELAFLVEHMGKELASRHYDDRGDRRNSRITLPHLNLMINSLLKQ